MPKPEERPAARPHDLILESRTTLTVTGVQKVLHCSPESAALETGKGTLHLAGAHVSPKRGFPCHSINRIFTKNGRRVVNRV